jgi:DNA-binding transcriptional ArsR family regulator
MRRGRPKHGGVVRLFLNITKALGDANRVRVLFALRGGELCACQLVEFLALAGSTVSKHLSVLYQAGLVEMRKEGRWVYYSLPGVGAEPAVVVVLDWVFRFAADEPAIATDARRLKQILELDPVELCRRQCRK